MMMKKCTKMKTSATRREEIRQGLCIGCLVHRLSDDESPRHHAQNEEDDVGFWKRFKRECEEVRTRPLQTPPEVTAAASDPAAAKIAFPSTASSKIEARSDNKRLRITLESVVYKYLCPITLEMI